eukprot:7105593-Prymnesium_polylepis.1
MRWRRRCAWRRYHGWTRQAFRGVDSTGAAPGERSIAARHRKDHHRAETANSFAGVRVWSGRVRLGAHLADRVQVGVWRRPRDPVDHQHLLDECDLHLANSDDAAGERRERSIQRRVASWRDLDAERR